MSKRNDLMRDSSNILESMGMGVPPAGTEASTSLVPPQLRGVDRMREAKMIPLDLIEPDPGQPRKEFDPESLTKLADSLRKRGQIQPVTVCWNDSQAAYVILTGERRWRAARQAGLEKLACIVRDKPLTEGELRAVQLIENCLREDLKPMEQAHAYRDLMTANDWSARRLGEELDLNHATILRALALLELPEDIQQRVARVPWHRAPRPSWPGSPRTTRRIWPRGPTRRTSPGTRSSRPCERGSIRRRSALRGRGPWRSDWTMVSRSSSTG